MPYATRSLADTVAVVTGASAGIGAATARTLLEAGAKVAVGARRAERLEELVALDEDRVVAVAGDVQDPEYNDRLVAAAVERWGRLDTVVANAGIGLYGGILDHSDDQVREMVDTNFTGSVFTVRSGVRQFREQGDGGDVLIVSSVAGFRGGAVEAVYAGTKHAQVGLGGALDRELRPEGIRVTLLCPAAVATEFAVGEGGREAGADYMDTFLTADDVAHAARTVLEQPRSVRTTVWQLWSASQDS